MATKSTTAERARPATEPGTLVLLCLAAWAIPGAGHFWLGRAQKGVVFLAALTMLVALAAFANAGLGLPWVVGRMLGLGGGVVTAATYEYGNSFLIVSGLLNFLVILDAFDIAVGRK